MTYNSRGCVLVIGEAARVRIAIDRLAPPLRIVAFVTGTAADAPAPAGVTWVAGKVAEVKGHLGRFTARSHGKDGKLLDCGPFSFNRDGLFDLVLDLNPQPLITTEVTPIGYFAPGSDDAALARALTELPQHVGPRHKPKYFAYEPGICARGSHGLTGCTRCLAVCPAGAIAERGDKIEIDPFLCQGCGTCTLVCPTGAVRYAYPAPGDALTRLKTMLDAFHGAGGAGPIVVVHERDGVSLAEGIPDPACLPYEVHGLGAFGIEAWLAALAYGARQVLLLATARTPASTLTALRAEVGVCQTLLAAIGDDDARIAIVERPEPQALAQSIENCGAPPRTGPWTAARFAAPAGKRAGTFAFFDYLNAHANGASEPVALAKGAEFGTIEVDRHACTVCLACVNLCPAQALAGREGAGPGLAFVEERCVQCGLCSTGCPEKAVTLVPRFVLDVVERKRECVLARSTMFPCTECGTPFISRAALEISIERLKDHPMFAGDGIRLLRLCQGCRRKATFVLPSVDDPASGPAS